MTPDQLDMLLYGTSEKLFGKWGDDEGQGKPVAAATASSAPAKVGATS